MDLLILCRLNIQILDSVLDSKDKQLFSLTFKFND
jgi:hypothetical protein